MIHMLPRQKKISQRKISKMIFLKGLSNIKVLVQLDTKF